MKTQQATFVLNIKQKKMDNTLKFKTNINCAGCVAKVTPFLDGETGIESWDVDTTSTDKVLTVQVDGLKEQAVIQTVEKAGFKIESL